MRSHSLASSPPSQRHDDAHLPHILISLAWASADMPLEGWINALELLLPLAVAVPVVGSPVQGSLEAAISILKLAQARRLRDVLHQSLNPA
jgi:hypothetical protein